MLFKRLLRCRIDAPNTQMQTETRSAAALTAGHSVGSTDGPAPHRAAPVGAETATNRVWSRCFLLSTQLPETRLPCHPNFWNSTTNVDELYEYRGFILFISHVVILFSVQTINYQAFSATDYDTVAPYLMKPVQLNSVPSQVHPSYFAGAYSVEIAERRRETSGF
jgi:hypothetical protein